jgi:predicted MFS family arabinose efflux permease
VLSALCASLVGVGLARFAYTPLIPALIAEQWFRPSQAVYLGAANLAGYLAGALLAGRVARLTGAVAALRAMMLLASASFFACALPLGFDWYLAWRLTAGLAGGVLMVFAAPTVLPAVPLFRRGLAGGAVFTGVGLGIAASGTLVPLLLRLGLAVTWCGLGGLAAALTVLAWRGWPAEPVRAGPLQAQGEQRTPRSGVALGALYVEYGLAAVGLVPHMIFLVDFVARGLGRGLAEGATYWVLFGLAAAVGPLLAGRLADRIGFGWALRLAFLVQAIAVLAITDGALGLTISSVVIGASVPGVVPLVLGRVQELAGPGAHRQTAAWSLATTAFALGQAVSAYGFSFLFARTGSYVLLFEFGAAALVLALVIDLAANRGPAPRSAAVQAQPPLGPGVGGERRLGRDLGP